MQLLLLSNSTMPGTPFLSWSKPHILDFLGSSPLSIAFIPDAVVTMDLTEYSNTVTEIFAKSGHEVHSVHNSNDPKKLLSTADVCMISGGNSFRLLQRLYEMDVMGIIQERVLGSSMKYIGWSAGSNVACPTIKTTNDMPIVQPPSFDALNLIPYQINPHYTEKTIEGHGGESRRQRLHEFLEMNRKSVVIGMKEGCGLVIDDEGQRFIGTGGVILQYNCDPIEFGEEKLTID